MKKLFFTDHYGNKFPIDLELTDYVMYRTTHPTKPKSHLHLPVMAKDLNWKKAKLGRILDYAVVNLTKLGSDTLNYTPIQPDPAA